MAIKWTDFLKWFASLLVLFLLPRDVQSQATQLETVRTSFASFGAIYYPHLIAKERGYYAEEGIDIEMILMPGVSQRLRSWPVISTLAPPPGQP